LTLTDFIPLLSLSMEEMYAYMLLFMNTPGLILDIFTFGVLLGLIALKNEEYHGNILLFTAICSVIHTILAYISIFLIEGSLSMGITPTGLILVVVGIINIISLIFLVMFNIFLILYSFKLEELYLKIPAILLLIITLITIITMILSLF